MRALRPLMATVLPSAMLWLAWGCTMIPQQQSPRDPFLVEPGLAPQQRSRYPRPTTPIEPTPGIDGSSRFQPPLRLSPQRQSPNSAPNRTTPRTFAEPEAAPDSPPSRSPAPPFRSDKRPAPVESLPDPITPPGRHSKPDEGPTLAPPEAAAPARRVTTAAASSTSIDLGIEAPDRRPVGSGAPFQVTVRNLTEQTLRNVSIVAEFDDGLEFPGSDQRTVTHKIPKIEAGDVKECRLTLIGRAEGRRRCHVAVHVGSREVAARETFVEFVSRQLEWQLHGPSERTVGSRAEFNIPLINVSQQPLRNVTVRVEHDAGLKVREMTRGGTLQDRSVTWTIDELAVDEGLLLQLEVECREPTSFACLTATVSGVDLPLDDAEACLAVIPLPGELDLRVQDISDPVAAGDIAELLVSVQNVGLQSVRNVELTCRCPEGFRFESAAALHAGKPIALDVELQEESVTFPVIERLDPDRRQEFRVRLRALQAGPQAIRFTVRDAGRNTPHEVTEPIMVHR